MQSFRACLLWRLISRPNQQSRLHSGNGLHSSNDFLKSSQRSTKQIELTVTQGLDISRDEEYRRHNWLGRSVSRVLAAGSVFAQSSLWNSSWSSRSIWRAPSSKNGMPQWLMWAPYPMLTSKTKLLMIDVVVNHFAWPGPPNTTDFSLFNPFNEARFFHPFCKVTNYDVQEMVENCWLGDSNVELVDVNTELPEVASTFSSWISQIVSNYSGESLHRHFLVQTAHEYFSRRSSYRHG